MRIVNGWFRGKGDLIRARGAEGIKQPKTVQILSYQKLQSYAQKLVEKFYIMFTTFAMFIMFLVCFSSATPHSWIPHPPINWMDIGCWVHSARKSIRITFLSPPSGKPVVLINFLKFLFLEDFWAGKSWHRHPSWVCEAGALNAKCQWRQTLLWIPPISSRFVNTQKLFRRIRTRPIWIQIEPFNSCRLLNC